MKSEHRLSPRGARSCVKQDPPGRSGIQIRAISVGQGLVNYTEPSHQIKRLEVPNETAPSPQK